MSPLIMDILRRQDLPPTPSPSPTPPPFVLPTDPEYYTWSVQPQLTAITLSLMIVALVAVIGRLYIRLFVLRVFRLDDYFIVAAMLCSVISCSIFLYVVSLGMGKHIWAIRPENLTGILKWIFVVSVFVPMSLGFVKFSIAFFLLSLTQRSAGYRRLLWGIIVFLIVFILFTFITLMIGCIPISANWNFNLRPPPIGKGTAKCLPVNTYRNIAFVNSVTNIITDVVLAVIPIPLVWTLQVNKRTKASLIFILSLGFFACAAGIIKTPLLFHFFDDMDSTGNRSWYYAWQIIEMNIGILAATLPSLKPAFRWLLETAKFLATGVSSHHARSRTRSTPLSPGYKRQFSSENGYIQQKDTFKDPYNLNTTTYTENLHPHLHPQRPGNPHLQRNLGNRRGNMAMGGDTELENLETNHDLKPTFAGTETGYNVTVAATTDLGDDKSLDGAGSNASSDAILRMGAQIAEGDAGERRIFRTTKVTIVTS